MLYVASGKFEEVIQIKKFFFELYQILRPVWNLKKTVENFFHDSLSNF